MSDTHRGSDMKAAFLGLILGAVVLFALVYGIVRLTNATYAREKPAPAAKG
jgi:hypothetical protein